MKYKIKENHVPFHKYLFQKLPLFCKFFYCWNGFCRISLLQNYVLTEGLHKIKWWRILPNRWECWQSLVWGRCPFSRGRGLRQDFLKQFFSWGGGREDENLCIQCWWFLKTISQISTLSCNRISVKLWYVLDDFKNKSMR